MEPRTKRNGLGAALQAGVEMATIGALAAIGLLIGLSRFAQTPWFAYGNLFSTIIYPGTVLEEGFGYWSLAGFALAFLYLVAAGIPFALLFRASRRGVAPHLVGVFYAVALFMLGDRLWWQGWSAYIVIYGVHSHLMWAHVLYGVALGGLPWRRWRLQADNSPEDATQPLQDPA